MQQETERELAPGRTVDGLLRAGRKAESDAALDELIEKYEKTMAFNIAYVLAFRGEADRAFEWLDKAVSTRIPVSARSLSTRVREPPFGPALAAVPAQARHGARAARGDQVRREGAEMNEPAPDGDIASVWSALRRRKVVQWGLVYVAAAWGFLQGLEYVSEAFHWPRQLRQIALLALLIGLPIVLVLAWYHGDRGQQRITTPEFAILTLLLLLGGGAFWYYQRASDAQTAAVAEGPKQSTAPPEAGVLRLAVLPLENLSPDPANAFFADGLHDEILSAIPATRELQVVSGTTMRSYAGTRKTVKQIALELGASHLLAGAVRRAGEHVRLSLHLVDAATDSNVWSRTFDRQLRDALSLQSEVANRSGYSPEPPTSAR